LKSKKILTATATSNKQPEARNQQLKKAPDFSDAFSLLTFMRI